MPLGCVLWQDLAGKGEDYFVRVAAINPEDPEAEPQQYAQSFVSAVSRLPVCRPISILTADCPARHMVIGRGFRGSAASRSPPMLIRQRSSSHPSWLPFVHSARTTTPG